MDPTPTVELVYDLHAIPASSAPVSEWYTLQDGTITGIEAYFDARPFVHMFTQTPGAQPS